MSRNKVKSSENKPIQGARKEYKFSSFAEDLINKHDERKNTPNRFKNFEIPKSQSPLIVKDGDQKLTNDSLPINSINFQQYGKINATLINSWFLGYQEYSLLSQNGIIQNIIQAYSQDCVREWIEIKSINKSKKEASEDKIRAINDRFEQLKVREKIKNAVELTIMFGGCKIYPKIKGDDSTEGGIELQLPFYKEKMEKGGLLYLKVIEPLYATPLQFNATDPLAEDYYVPTNWSILAKQIHSSRLCHFAYNYVPTLLKPIYWFNGYPLVQLCLDYLMGFETVRQNVVGVSGRYNINVFKTNMDALLYNEGTFSDSFYKRLKLAQELQTNFSIFAMSNDPASPEEWQQFNMTIAGLDALLNQNAELVCAVTRIPAIKLFGTSPKGFNATGDNELRIYYDLIRSIQTSVIQPNLQQIFELVQIDLFGKIDPDLQIHFKSLWTESAVETSQIQLNKANINSIYFDKGILGASEIRESLNGDPNSGYSDLAENFEEADEDELTDEESEEEAEEAT